MSGRQRLLTGILAMVMATLGAASPVTAADLDLRITSVATGRLVAEESVRLAPGEEVRLVQTGVRLPGRDQAVDLVLGITLEEEASDHVRVSLHGIVRAPGAATPIAWTSRSYRLAAGEAAAFTVEADRTPVEFAARFGTDGRAAVRPDADPVRLTTLLRVTEQRAEGPVVLEERSVRLVGPGATEVVFSVATADGQAVALVLQLRPRGRDEDTALLDLTVESRGVARVIRQASLSLGFDDGVEVRALEGPHGPLVVEIRPER